MAKTPEAKVKDAIKKVLDAFGIWYFMPIGGPFTVHGIPDFICCWKGQFLAIEAKAPGKLTTTTVHQVRKIGEINAHGGWAIVVDDAQQLVDFLNARSKSELRIVPGT